MGKTGNNIMALTDCTAMGYNVDMALDKVKVRFAPNEQIQIRLPQYLIEQIKKEGEIEGRGFSGQVRWILSKTTNVSPLEGLQILKALREQADDMSGHIRKLLQQYYEKKNI